MTSLRRCTKSVNICLRSMPRLALELAEEALCVKVKPSINKTKQGWFYLLRISVQCIPSEMNKYVVFCLIQFLTCIYGGAGGKWQIYTELPFLGKNYFLEIIRIWLEPMLRAVPIWWVGFLCFSVLSYEDTE